MIWIALSILFILSVYNYLNNREIMAFADELQEKVAGLQSSVSTLTTAFAGVKADIDAIKELIISDADKQAILDSLDSAKSNLDAAVADVVATDESYPEVTPEPEPEEPIDPETPEEE